MSRDQQQVNPIPTERFQRVLAFASDEADGLGHGFVTCQHLLYALSRESKGVASAVLDGMGVTPEGLHELLADAAAPHDRTSEGRIDLADEARDALERAVEAAREWGHRALDTEHILYGIAMAPSSADEMFISLHVDPDHVLKRLNTVRQTAPSPAVRDEATHAYRFTLESAWLLSQAVDVARRTAARQVTSLHLLVSLLAMPGPAQEVLARDLALDENSLARYLQPTAVEIAPRRLPLAEDVQRILGYAIGEAWNRGHLAVTPLHLAMGIARAERHAARDILAELGISQSELQEALEAAMPPSVLH